MASVTGSRLAFFGEGVSDANKINIVLTTDGTDAAALAAAAVAGDLNIEVFTSTPNTLATGYQASAFIQGAQLLSNNAVQAGSPTSIEQLLASVPDTGKGGSGFTGNLVLDDFSGGAKAGESISIVGSTGQAYSVFGSKGDTITGSSDTGVSNYIDASGTLTPKNPPSQGGPFPGAETIFGGAGLTTVRGGTGDSITGGTGDLVVTDEHHDGNQTVKGGSGALRIFNIGQNFSITGSSGGTTFINDDYGNGGGSSIVGGSGSGLLTDKGLSGENTFIVAASTDQVTVGSALTYLIASKGDTTITGGDGGTTGTVEGAAGYNTNIVAGKGDVITLGAAATYVDASAGSTSITGGNPATGSQDHIEAGKGDSIIGGSGRLDVNNIGNGDTVKGTIGNLFSFGKGTGELITGSQQGWTLIDSGGSSSIVGGNGTTTVPASLAGGAVDDTIINAGGGDTITAGSGSNSGSTTYINALADGSADTVGGGSGPTTVLAGKGDSVIGAGGTLTVDFDSDQNGQATTVDLSKGTGAATLRDVNAGGNGTNVTVTGVQANPTASGFPETSLTIASATTTPVEAMASAKSDGKGGTLITFNDKSTLDLVGVTDITKITFTS